MLKSVKKTVAAILCCSVLAGMCACASSNNDRKVLNAAESLGIAVTKRDVSAVNGLSSEEAEGLGDVMTFADAASDNDLRAKEKIASTLTYTVDQESLTGKSSYKSGTVDIMFSFVDYGYVCSDSDNLRGIDTFERAVDECGDMIEVRLTFDYVLEDDKVTFSGLEQISDVFPYADETFDFTVNYPAFVDGIYFAGDVYDQDTNTYTDTYGIHSYMEIAEQGQALDWSYYYTIDLNGENVYTSSVFTADDSEYLDAVYTSAARLEEGVYTVSFYSADDQFLGSANVEVVVTITPGTPTDMVDPAAASFYDSPYYVMPDDNVILLPDSDVTITLPDDLECRDFNYFLSARTPYTELADNVVFYASDDSCYCLAIRLPFENYMSQDAYDYIGFVDDGQATIEPEFYEDAPSDMEEYFTTIGQYDYTVGGRYFRCLEISNVGMTSGVTLEDYYLIGDDDTCYVFIVRRTFTLEEYATADYSADDFIPCISVG